MLDKLTYDELEQKVKRLERESLELNKTKERLFRIEKAVESSSDAIGMSDSQGNHFYQNKAFTNLFEYTVEELDAKGGGPGVYANQDVAREVFRTIMNGNPWAGEVEMVSKSGRMFPVFLRADAINDDAGNTLGLIGFHTDLTKRKQAEELYQESEQRFRLLVEATSDLVWELDRKGVYTYASQNVEKFLGYKSEEVIGKTPFDFMRPDEAKRTAKLYHELCERGTPFSAYESTVIHRDGRRVVVETSGFPIFDVEGNLIRFRGVDRDITERVRSREQMFQAAKMVSLGSLVSGVAHEINNPITAVMLNGPILQKIWSDILPVLDEYCQVNGDIQIGNAGYSQLRQRVPVLLSDITEGAKRVKRIVDELKDFARQSPAHLSDMVDINEVVDKALGLVNNMIKKSTNHFEVNYGVDMPQFIGNIQHIEQVVINLVINACEALPDTERSILVSTDYDRQSDSVEVRVRDHGEGIPPELLERLGDPFFTTRRDSGGTGLGLAIANRIIKDHGGTIDFDSVQDQGTTVTVRFPIRHPSNNRNEVKND